MKRVGLGGLFRLGLILLTILALPSFARAVEVTASLSENATAVGRPVQFRVQIEGASSANVPDNFAVDGLDIRFAGQAHNVQLNNFTLTRAVTYTFLVIPEREGTFTLPGLSVEVDGKTYKTPALSLKATPYGSAPPVSGPAQGSPQPPISQLAQQMQQQLQQMQQQLPPGLSPPSSRARPQTQSQAAPPDQLPAAEKLAFAQLLIPEQKNYFVGQSIPVEIRFYFDSRFPMELASQISFGGEGFTAEKLSEPAEKRQVVEGVPYNVYAFKTVITPIKPGSLEVPPAQLRCVATLPSRNPPPDDFFGNLLGQMGSFGEQRELEVSSNSVKLEVKPLPREGRPTNFAGAIGQFSLDAEASPKEVATGEPITLKLRIEGQGNFNALTEPTLAEKTGWRIYPGATDFTPSDATGFSGRKTFESMLVAVESQTATPIAEFSYFDPSAEKYVTLRTEAIPVNAPAGKAAPTAAPKIANTSGSTPEPSVVPEDSEGITVLPSYSLAAFQTVFQRREFWIANAAAGVAFVALLAYWISLRIASGASAQLARQRKAREKLLQEMAAPGLDARAFAEKGVAYLIARYGTAAPESWPSDGESAEDAHRLESMLTLYNETKYGIGRTVVDLSTERRAEILTVLKKWEAVR